MAKAKVSDFYYGAVLSMLLNSGVTPVLVEGNEDRQVYDLITNNKECRLFIKYRAKRQNNRTKTYSSWSFVFNDGERNELLQNLDEGFNVLVVLVCGVKGLNGSEIAVLNTDEIKELIKLDKNSITISRKRNEKAFRISVGGGRDNAMQIKTNQFEELLIN